MSQVVQVVGDVWVQVLQVIEQTIHLFWVVLKYCVDGQEHKLLVFNW